MKARATAALNNLYDFLVDYWGLDLEEQPHRNLCDLIQQAEFDEDKPYCMEIVPRYSFKSSIVRGALVWKQLRQIHLFDNVYHRIMLASATLLLSRETLGVIEQQLRYNEKIATDFGSLWKERGFDLQGSKRTDSLMIAPRIEKGETPKIVGASFWIASLKRQAIGQHADEAFIDDLNIDSNSGTAFQREKVKQFYRMCFPLIGNKDARGRRTRMTFTGTTYHDDDVRGMIQREEAARELENPDSYRSPWHIYQQGSYMPDGTAFFPARYDLKTLERLRQDMSTVEFARQFLCDPVGNSGLVEEDLIKFKPRAGFPNLTSARITVDPNQHNEAKEAGCYCAIVVSGYDRFARMYVQDARGSREWDTQAIIEQLFLVQEDYPSYPIFIEDEHMSHFRLAVQMEEAARSEVAGQRVHLRLHYVPADRKSSKYDRWQKLVPRFKNYAIVFADEIAPSIKVELKDELVRGQAARFKDFLDALAMAETGIRPRVDKTGQVVAIDAGKADPATKQNVLTFADAVSPKLQRKFGWR